MKRILWIACGGMIGVLVAAAVLEFNFTDSYRSTAVLRSNPSTISNRYVPATPIDLKRMMQSTAINLFSRAMLTNIIQSHGLYEKERARVPMEDVIELMRKDVEIQPTGVDSVRVSFTYYDQLLAQKVNQDFMNRILSEHYRSLKIDASTTIDFLTARAEEAAKEWETSENIMKQAEAKGIRNARLMLDIDLARDRYKSARERLSEANTALALVGLRLGPTLEMLDPASYPQHPTRNVAAILSAGAAAGLVGGYLVGVLLALLRGKPAHRISPELNA